MQSKRSCSRAIAQVISTGDLKHQKGASLCKNDIINPNKNQKVAVRCQNSGRIVFAASGSIIKLCNLSKGKIEQRHRGGIDQSTGMTFRGPNTFARLQRPFGQNLIEGHPYLKWEPAKDADSYLVSIQGHDFNWQQTIHGTSLQYPMSQPSLVPGRIYKVSIIAYIKSKEVSQVTATYSILDHQIASKIRNNIRELDKQGLSNTELALKRDSNYMSQGLLEKSIQSLEVAVNSGANQKVRDLLAKRYEEAGFPELANDLVSQSLSNATVIASSPLI